MSKYLRLVPILFWLAARAAGAAPVEFVGDYSIDIDPAADSVTVEIAELRNTSPTDSTGRLFVSLIYTQCDAPTSTGYPSLVVEDEDGQRQDVFPLDRVVSGGNSTLAPEASWTGIRFTTGYLPPPPGTFRAHLVIYESDDSDPDEVAAGQSGAASLPGRHVERGADEYDSCFTARPLDANEQRGNRLGFYDRSDYFRLQSYSRGALTVEITGDVDAVGELLDSEGRLLDSGSKGVGSENLRIERHIDDRVYYFRVAAGGEAFGAYTLRATHAPGTGGAARDRDDDTMERATPLPLGVEVGDAIDEPGDDDWWSFETRESGRFIIETAGGTDTSGRLLDASAEPVAADDDSGEGRNFRIDDGAFVEAGTYYLRVTGGSSFYTGPYTLRAVHVPADATGSPDLVVDLPDANTLKLRPGERFVFYADVRNRGNGASDESVVRFYRSADRMISLGDIWHSTERVDALDPFSSREHIARFHGTEETGHYYVGACAGGVEGESDSDSRNNCSDAVRVVVSDTAGAADAEPVARRYSVPLFLSAADSRRHGFIRLVNRSDEPGTVSIHAVNDAGVLHGPVEISLDARETIHFNSEDLESGNVDKDIAGSTGAGTGDWRLELTTGLDIAPLAYVRTEDGFLTSMHDTAEALDDGRYYIPFFNPASNTRQVSSLRLVNPGTEDAGITVTGIDDRGAPPPEGEAWLNLPAGEARVITAEELESGGDILQGRFGPGSGKWRLFLSATAPIEASSLLDSPTGNLSNLSSRGLERSLPLVLPFSLDGRQGFVRIINWSDTPGSVRIRGVPDLGRRTEAVTLALDAGAAAHFNSRDLEFGNEAKGLSGGIGHRDGDWRLELQSELDLEALAYVRTDDGFVTGMHDLAVKVEGIVDVPFFNPASNANQESRLRLVNTGEDSALVTISGRDDVGAAPSYGAVRVTVRAGDSRTVTARELEAGARGLRGRFGDGIGKWRLSVASEQPIEVMSLLESPTGNLTNLSSPGGGAQELGSEGGPGSTGS